MTVRRSINKLTLHNVRPDINEKGEVISEEYINELRIQQENEKKIKKCRNIFRKLDKCTNSDNTTYFVYKSWGKKLIYIYMQVNINQITLFTHGLCFFGANEIYIPITNTNNNDIVTMLRLLDDILYFTTTGNISTSFPSNNTFYIKRNKLLYQKHKMKKTECSALHKQLMQCCNHLQLGGLIPKLEFTEINLVEDYSSGS